MNIQTKSSVNRLLKRSIVTMSIALSLGLFNTAYSETEIRIVHKDLLTTNPDDVKHINRIEQAMREQGKEVKISIVDLPSSGYADALGVKLLSGDIPDMIYFQGGDAKIVEQGVLEDLNPWIDKTTYLKDALYPHNEARLANYPYLLYIFSVRMPQPVIRKDWLEKAGGKVPETLNDFVELLKVIRDGDFDGDGKSNTFGITVAGSTDEMDAIFNQAFGIDQSWLQDDSGKFIASRISLAEKDKIAFYHSLKEQGLLDPEYLTTKWDVKEDKFYNGRVGIIFGSTPEIIDIYRGKMRQMHPEAELVLLPPPKGDKGQGLQAVDTSKEPRGFAVSALSENKQGVVDFLDFLASPQGQMMEQLGFEGIHYTKEGDTFKATEALSTWYPRFMVASNWVSPINIRSEAATQFITNTNNFFSADNAFIFPADYAADIDAADNIYRSWVHKFISGSEPIDKWDEFVKEWYNAGGKSLTDYANKILTEK